MHNSKYLIYVLVEWVKHKMISNKILLKKVDYYN